MNYSQLVNEIQSYLENTYPVTDINTFIQQAEQRIFNSVQFPSLRKNVTGNLTAGNTYLSCPYDFLAPYSLAVINNGIYHYLLNKDVNYIRQAYPDTTYQNQPWHYALFGPQSSAPLYLSFMVGPTPDQSYPVELHYFFYPDSIIQAPVATLGSITCGSGYVDGTYYNVPFTGGSGTGAQCNITVLGGVVTACTLTVGGTGYVPGDVLSAANSYLGGTGINFSIPVTSVTNATGQSWLGDNFDSVLLYGSLVEAYTYMKGDKDLLAFYDNKYKEALAIAKRLGDGMDRQDAYRSGQVRISVP